MKQQHKAEIYSCIPNGLTDEEYDKLLEILK